MSTTTVAPPSEPIKATDAECSGDRAKPARRRIARKHLLLAEMMVVGAAVYVGWRLSQPAELHEGFVSSNGHIEAREIDVATKLACRIGAKLVHEGEFVEAGQVLGHMGVEVFEAERREGVAQFAIARGAVETAQSSLSQRRSEKSAAEFEVAQREAELDFARSTISRTEGLGITRPSFGACHPIALGVPRGWHARHSGGAPLADTPRKHPGLRVLKLFHPSWLRDSHSAISASERSLP